MAAADLTAAEKLGYEFGHAFGSVEPELARLAALETFQAEAPSVAALSDALDALDDAIKALPEGDARREMQGQAEGIRLNIAAIQELDGAVEHQQRAVDEARAMPTILVASHPDLPHFRLYLDDTDQPTVDTLADPAVHAERVWQEQHPDEMAAAATLAGKGYTVEREAGASSFTVDGTAVTAAKIVARAESAKAKPSVPQLVAEVLLTAPELGAATRQALEEALGGPQA